jgi:hypothetical protein
MPTPYSLSEIKKLLRAGPYAWPGGYPLYFVMGDGTPASFSGVRNEWKRICRAYLDQSDCFEADWLIIGCEINWDEEMICELSHDLIPAAY